MSQAQSKESALVPKKSGDLTVTALYTSETWNWGGFKGASLLASKESRVVFRVTNFFLALYRLFRWSLPSLRCSLVQRHVMMDRLLEASQTSHVLEVAAGLSRRGAAFSENAALRYTELDLAHVVAKKRELFARSDEGRAVLARKNYQLLSGDVHTTDLQALVPPGAPVFVIAEGLLMYFAADEQRALWRRMAKLLDKRPGSAFVFDLVPAVEQPRPGLIGRLLGGIMKAFTKGRTFERDARTRDDLCRELEACGFSSVEIIEPHRAPAAWNLPFLGTKTQMMVFACRR